MINKARLDLRALRHRIFVQKTALIISVFPTKISDAVETAGFEMIWAFRNFESGHGPNTGGYIVKKKLVLPSISSTLINQYSTLGLKTNLILI